MTPQAIRDSLLERFYKMATHAVHAWGLDTFADDTEREVRWLVQRRWLEKVGGSLRISSAGRDEYERRQVEGGGSCPRCGHDPLSRPA